METLTDIQRKYPHLINQLGENIIYEDIGEYELLTNNTLDYSSIRTYKCAPYNLYVNHLQLIYLMFKYIDICKDTVILTNIPYWTDTRYRLFNNPVNKYHEFLDIQFLLRQVNTKYDLLIYDMQQDAMDMSIETIRAEHKEIMELHKHINPLFTIAKFRMPYTTKDEQITFFEGDIYPQIYTDSSSTNCWIIIKRDARIITYSTRTHDDRMYYHNMKVRCGIFNNTLNRCPCYDCSIIHKFFQLYLQSKHKKLNLNTLDKLYKLIHPNELHKYYKVRLNGQDGVTTLANPAKVKLLNGQVIQIE